MEKEYSCRKVSPGTAKGEVLISTEPLLFYHTDPSTGVVTEEGHCLEGKSIAGKILVFPGGKGSSVVQADGMYKLERGGCAPAGFIVQNLDTVLVSSAIIMEVPMVWKVDEAFYQSVKDGDLVRMDAERETLYLGEKDADNKNGERRQTNMEPVILNGFDFTLNDLYDVAFHGRKVEIAPEAYERLAQSRRIMQDRSRSGKQIYGFNKGLGQNKDQDIDESLLEKQNIKVLRSHSLGVLPYNSDVEVRAMMAIRLNNLLIGASCASDGLANIYRDFLNHGITPRVPSRGSVGEADITTLSHIGLAFIGEGEVSYRGKIVGVREAMEQEGLEPHHMELKDAHTVILSNSQGEATAAVLVHEVEQLVRMSDLVFCLDYEGFNGNVEAMREDVNKLRGLPGQIACAARCRKYLEGSYLYEDCPGRALQDPLTFRGGFTITGTVTDALDVVKKFLKIQINSPSDNPCVIPDQNNSFVNSNFETTTLAVAVEMLSIALGHLSRAVSYRMIRMCEPAFTNLPRFLAPRDGSSRGYNEIQNTISALDAENRSLIHPCSTDFFYMQGGVEDHASNLPLVVARARKLTDNLRYLVGMESLYAAQAVDLRRDQNIHLGKYTKKAYDTIRSHIPELASNRNLYFDIQAAYELVRSEKLLEQIEE